MAVPTARITAQHLQTTSFQGQMVRAVGKLVAEGENSVTLQLAGEGRPAPHPYPRRSCRHRPLAPRASHATRERPTLVIPQPFDALSVVGHITIPRRPPTAYNLPVASFDVTSPRALTPSPAAGPTATVHCPGGTQFFSGYADKGFFEVVGTLNSDATISSMQTVYMGDNFGARNSTTTPMLRAPLGAAAPPSRRPQPAPINRPCILALAAHRPGDVRRDGDAHAPVPGDLLGARRRTEDTRERREERRREERSRASDSGRVCESEFRRALPLERRSAALYYVATKRA